MGCADPRISAYRGRGSAHPISVLELTKNEVDGESYEFVMYIELVSTSSSPVLEAYAFGKPYLDWDGMALSIAGVDTRVRARQYVCRCICVILKKGRV